ncbi:MAG: T9SS type A sorting domain-containing protein [Flavobacteriales bacterium]
MRFKILLILILFYTYNEASAQFIISNDTAICVGSELTLQAAGANSSPSLVNVDDIHSDIIDIGFDFNFYGNVYNQCVLSANGYITFDFNQAGVFSPWTIGAAIPNPNNVPENAIMSPWHDIDPGVDGNIIFGTYGSAPNRVFYVVWCNIPMFQCNDLLDSQYILLYESSNNIEMHIEEKPICGGWNGGTAVQGLVNENSTLFEIVEDPVLAQPRNFPLQWQANNEGWLFVPNADFTDYEISQIPFLPITTGTITWLDQFGNIISNELTVDVSPQLIGDNYFYISIEDVCSGELIENADSILIQVAPPTNAGLDSTVYLCNIDSLQDLNSFISGDYDNGGDWFSPSDEVVSNILLPSIAQSGTYTYITYGIHPNCNDTSFVEVIIDELQYPGVEGFKLVCSADDPFDMFGQLNDNPDGGGIWYDPNDNLVSNIFDPSNSLVGQYTYLIEGINACPSVSQNLNISYQESFNIDVYTQPVTCPGESDGSIFIIQEEGTVTPVSFSIDNGQEYVNYSTFNNLDFGQYTVLVKDGNGCVTDQVVEIESAEEPIQVVANSTNVLCPGDELGQLFVDTVIGGDISIAYNYSWFSSENDSLVGTTSTLNAPAGGYYLIVSQSNCFGTEYVNIEDYNELTFEVTSNDVSCFGSEDGAINVNISGGGTPPYSFNWLTNGGLNSNSLFNLPAATYSLEITDSNDCITNIDVDINSPSSALSLESVTSNLSCYESPTGSINVDVTGGFAPYYFNWSSGHSSSQVENVFAGEYIVNVTDNGGCFITDTIIVDQNPQIITNLISQDVSCYGGFDGIASVIQTTGGSGNFSYTWSNGFQSQSISNLSFGEYSLVTEDNLGCSIIDTIFINQPNPIKVVLSPSDVLCYGDATGSITAYVDGGTTNLNGFYNYQWLLNNQQIGFNLPLVTNLEASQYPYQLLVTDLNNCSGSAYTFVDEPSELLLDTSEIVSAYCQNVPTGSLSVIANGGFLNSNSTYYFYWNNGVENHTVTDQNAGQYTAYVQDDNLCLDSLVLDIPLEPTFSSNIYSDSLNCFNDNSGQAHVSVSGGFSPYIYSWNFSGTTETSVSGLDSDIKGGLNSGIVSVVVEDVNGCVVTNQTELLEPTQLFYSVFKDNDQSCSGDVSSCDGKISISAFGGLPPYTFKWYDLQDNIIGINTTNDSLVVIDNLCAGTYKFEVTDQNNCLATINGNLSPTIEIISGYEVSSEIDLNSFQNNIVCNGDTSAYAEVYNSNPSFSYLWKVNGEQYSSGLNATLPAGNITLEASYQSCSTVSSPLIIDQPSSTIINSDITHASCYGSFDGSIEVEALDAQQLTYSWSNGGTTPSVNQLSAGNYTLTITNQFDCQTIFDFSVNEPSQIIVSESVTDVSCNGEEDGTAFLDLSGGIEPIFVDWQGLDPLNLPAGNHNVVFTDANNCSQSYLVTINQPAPLVATFDVNSIPFIASASGGTTPYTYQWLYFGSLVGNSSSYIPNQDGNYTLVVTDNLDCEARIISSYEQESVNISENDLSSILVYPNPFISHMTIVSDKKDIIDIKLIDSRGRTIHEAEFSEKYVLKRNGISEGVYTLFLTSSTEKIVKKIIVPIAEY